MLIDNKLPSTMVSRGLVSPDATPSRMAETGQKKLFKESTKPVVVHHAPRRRCAKSTNMPRWIYISAREQFALVH